MPDVVHQSRRPAELQLIITYLLSCITPGQLPSLTTWAGCVVTALMVFSGTGSTNVQAAAMRRGLIQFNPVGVRVATAIAMLRSPEWKKSPNGKQYRHQDSQEDSRQGGQQLSKRAVGNRTGTQYVTDLVFFDGVLIDIYLAQRSRHTHPPFWT